MPFERGFCCLVLSAVALGGCGGAALGSGAESSGAPATREPLTELEALQRDFDLSEAELSARLDRRQERSAEPTGQAAPKAAAADDAPKDGVGSRCDHVCRAMGSMRRSADGICALTSGEHERCVGARSRVEVAAQKVAATGCSCRP